MIALFVAASVLPVQIACTNCNGVGYFEVDCPRCSGSGSIHRRVKKSVTRSAYSKDYSLFVNESVPCPDCIRGLSSKGKKGTGKKKVTCKVCRGQKKIRK